MIPTHVATSPRNRLPKAYSEASRNAPLRRVEMVSHSYV
jgi:hypothetical protein